MNDGALLRCAGDQNLSAQTFGSFRHAQQTEMPVVRADAILRRKTFSIVLNLQMTFLALNTNSIFTQFAPECLTVLVTAS